MENQKKNRIAAAITVNVILLIVILAAVIIYQLVEIVAVNNRRNQLKKEIEEYERLIEQSKNDLDYLQSEQYLLDLAFKLGYDFPHD